MPNTRQQNNAEEASEELRKAIEPPNFKIGQHRPQTRQTRHSQFNQTFNEQDYHGSSIHFAQQQSSLSATPSSSSSSIRRSTQPNIYEFQNNIAPIGFSPMRLAQVRKNNQNNRPIDVTHLRHNEHQRTVVFYPTPPLTPATSEAGDIQNPTSLNPPPRRNLRKLRSRSTDPASAAKLADCVQNNTIKETRDKDQKHHQKDYKDQNDQNNKSSTSSAQQKNIYEDTENSVTNYGQEQASVFANHINSNKKLWQPAGVWKRPIPSPVSSTHSHQSLNVSNSSDKKNENGMPKSQTPKNCQTRAKSVVGAEKKHATPKNHVSSKHSLNETPLIPSQSRSDLTSPHSVPRLVRVTPSKNLKHSPLEAESQGFKPLNEHELSSEENCDATKEAILCNAKTSCDTKENNRNGTDRKLCETKEFTINPNKRAKMSESPSGTVEEDNLKISPESGSAKRRKRPKLKLPKMIKRSNDQMARDAQLKNGKECTKMEKNLENGKESRNTVASSSLQGVCTRQTSHSRYHLRSPEARNRYRQSADTHKLNQTPTSSKNIPTIPSHHTPHHGFYKNPLTLSPSASIISQDDDMMSQVSGHSGAPRPKPPISDLPAMRALNTMYDNRFERPWHLSMSWQISTGVPITPSPQKTDEGNRPIFPGDTSPVYHESGQHLNQFDHPVPYNLRNLPDHPYHRPHENMVTNFSSTDSEEEGMVDEMNKEPSGSGRRSVNNSSGLHSRQFSQNQSSSSQNVHNNAASSQNVSSNSFDASSSNRKLSFSNVNHQYGSHQYEMHPGAAPPPPYSSFHGSGKTYADYQIMTRSQAAILMHSISFADSSASSASETEEEELDQKRFGEIDIAEMERDCVN